MTMNKSMNTGFMRQENGKEELVGQKAIWAHLGGHRSGLLQTTSVSAYWGFDKEDKLIDIWIRSENDSL